MSETTNATATEMDFLAMFLDCDVADAPVAPATVAELLVRVESLCDSAERCGNEYMLRSANEVAKAIAVRSEARREANRAIANARRMITSRTIRSR
jgi:hypothetical protein